MVDFMSWQADSLTKVSFLLIYLKQLTLANGWHWFFCRWLPWSSGEWHFMHVFVTIHFYKIFLLQISDDHLSFLLEKESLRSFMVSTNILNSTTVLTLIVNNKKCFLSIKAAYQKDFWKITWHLTGVIMLKIQLCITWINYILKYI